MKIIILVQACDDPPYAEMQKAQAETWDSIDHPECETIYFLGNNKGKQIYIGKKLYINCSESYKMMHWRCKIAMDMMYYPPIFDFIFRTNASSYINKTELVNFAKTLPTEKCYCGIDGGSYASGAGMFMSPDVVDIVRKHTDSSPTAYEDAYIGSILGRNGIKVTPGARRFDIDHNNYDNIPRAYHYRCKSDNEDRTKDIIAMKKIFEKYPNN